MLEHIQDLLLADPVARADGLRRLEKEPARKDADPLEELLLLGLQELVAPVHGGPERLLPLERRGASGGEKAEPVLETSQDLGHGQDLHACGGQLDRERDAVQAPADLRHRPGVLVREREAGLHRSGPVHEEPH